MELFSYSLLMLWGETPYISLGEKSNPIFYIHCHGVIIASGFCD